MDGDNNENAETTTPGGSSEELWVQQNHLAPSTTLLNWELDDKKREEEDDDDDGGIITATTTKEISTATTPTETPRALRWADDTKTESKDNKVPATTTTTTTATSVSSMRNSADSNSIEPKRRRSSIVDLDEINEGPHVRRNRIFLFAFSVLYTALFAGAYLSFGPMQLMLEDDGAFSNKCTPEEQAAGQVCPSQTDKLLQVILISQFMSSTAPALGYIADHLGALALMHLLSVAGCLGILLLLLSSVTELSWLLFPAFIFISIMFVSTSIMTVQTGLIFQGDTRRQMISLLNNLIDAGGVTYLLLYELYGAVGENFVAVSGGYLGLAVFCFGGASCFWRAVVADIGKSIADASAVIDETEKDPSTSYSADDGDGNLVSEPGSGGKASRAFDELPIVKEEENGEGSESNVVWEGDEEEDEEGSEEVDGGPKSCSTSTGKSLKHSLLILSAEDDETLLQNASRFGAAALSVKSGVASSQTSYELIAKRSPAEQLKSEQFICVVLLFLCHDARTAFVASTARDFLASLGDDEMDNRYLAIFTYINVASLVALPFTDKLLDKLGYHFAFQLVNVLSIANGLIMVASDNLNVQVLGFVIFSFYRSLTFSAIFSFMPVFLGGDVVGRGTGIMTCLAGVFGLINIPLASLSVNTLDGDFFWANLFYTLFVVPFSLVAWRIGRGIQKEEAATAVESQATLRRVSTVRLRLSTAVELTAAPTFDANRRWTRMSVVATMPDSPGPVLAKNPLASSFSGFRSSFPRFSFGRRRATAG